jgi:hypothetical protein
MDEEARYLLSNLLSDSFLQLATTKNSYDEKTESSRTFYAETSDSSAAPPQIRCQHFD